METVGGGVTRKRCVCSGKGNPVLLSWLDLGRNTSEKEKDPGYPCSWGWKGESYEAGCDPLAPRGPEASREGKRWVQIRRSKLQIGYEMEEAGLERVVGVWGGRESSALKIAVVEEEGWAGDGKRGRQQ